MRRWFTRLAVVGVLLHAALGAAETPPSTAPQLAGVDRLFYASYERAVHVVLADGPPAFLVLPERLVLYRRGVQQEWPLIPPQFNELKTIAHVTLGLFAVLGPSDGGPLAADDVVAAPASTAVKGGEDQRPDGAQSRSAPKSKHAHTSIGRVDATSTPRARHPKLLIHGGRSRPFVLG